MNLAQIAVSTIPNGVGYIGMKVAGKKSRTGWAIGVWSEVAWLGYAIWTSQWGVVPWCFIWAKIYVQNWLKWKREEATIDKYEHQTTAEAY